MERIIWIALILLVIPSVFAVTDLTPVTTPAPLNSNPVYAVNSALDESRTLTAISRLESRITQLNDQISTLPSNDKLNTVRQQIADDAKQQQANALAQTLILLIVWQVFFFATMFIMKSKRWF